MEYHHITQEVPDSLTVGDQLSVVFDEDEGAQSGKYIIAAIYGQGPYEIMLVGTDGTKTAGYITSVFCE